MTPKNLVIAVPVVIVLAIAFGVTSRESDILIPNYTHQNQNTPRDTNNSSAQLHDQQLAEEHAQQLWDQILADANGPTKAWSYAGLTFEVPKSMVFEQTGQHFPAIRFPIDPNVLPEQPTMVFSTSTSTPNQLNADAKSKLSQYETMKVEKSLKVGDLTWLYTRQSTDFGIDNVVWAARVGTKTVVVSYPYARGVEIFEKIVRSGKLST